MTDREQERAAVVRWLRGKQRANELAFEKALAIKGKDHHHVDRFAISATTIEELTDEIERGEHIKETRNDG